MKLPMKLPLLAAALACGLSIHAAEADSTEAAAGAPPAAERLAWWREARFGMFIHWGPVSLKGTEISWSRGGERRGYGSHGTEIPVEVYDNLYKQFNPTNFNARPVGGDRQGRRHEIPGVHQPTSRRLQRVRHARRTIIRLPRSIARSTVTWSKNWRRPVTAPGCALGCITRSRTGITRMPLPTDIRTTWPTSKTQARELLTNYGPLDIFWFDGLGKTAKDYDAEALNRMIRKLQPRILINNRDGLAEDFDTPEQVIGKFQYDRPWESCITICNQWAWKPNDQMKTLPQCLETLILCAGGDGNLLFNVGPMPDGRIEPRQVERLAEMGEWLEEVR